MAQAMNGRPQNDLKYLTDCTEFIQDNCDLNDTCPYRHCYEALIQPNDCQKWPQTCRNVMCPYRHSDKASIIPQSSIQTKNLVSIFWDIENVPIPRGQNPFTIVQRIRQKLINEPGLQEADFSCYSNISKLSEATQISLHHANVRIVHVPDRKTGAADRQIMLDLARFERVHRPPATAILISGDIDFVGILSGLRHQAGFRVIVVHNKPAKEELKATVHEHYPWELFTEAQKEQPTKVLVQNIDPIVHERKPREAQPDRMRRRSRNRSIHRRDSSPKLSFPPNIPSLMANNQEIKKYQCPKCPNEFESIQSLRQHQNCKNHLFRCPVCPESFVTALGQTQHQKDKNHYVLKHKCDQCNHYFSKIESLKQHEQDTGHRSADQNTLVQGQNSRRSLIKNTYEVNSNDDNSRQIISEGIEAIRQCYAKRSAKNK